MSSLHRARITKAPAQPIKTFTRQFAPITSTSAKTPASVKLTPHTKTPLKVSNTPQLKNQQESSKNLPGFLSARVSQHDEAKNFRLVRMGSQKEIRTARESPTFQVSSGPVKTEEDSPSRPNSGLRSRRMKTETEKESFGSMELNSKGFLKPIQEVFSRENVKRPRRLQSEHHLKGVEAYGLIPQMRTEESQPTTLRVLDLIDDWHKGSNVAPSSLTKVKSTRESKKNEISEMRETIFRRSNTFKDSSTKLKMSIEDIKKKYFPMLNAEIMSMTDANRSDHFMGSTATSRSRMKIPTNREETEHDFSLAINSYSSLNDIDGLDLAEKEKKERPDIFSSHAGSFFEINTNNKGLMELQRQYKGSEATFFEENKPIEKTHGETLKQTRHMTGHRFNHEPEIVTISQGKSILQPVYMEKAGSMCYTELWDTKQRRKIKEIMKEKVSTLRLVNPEREAEALYKPGKWKKESIIQKRIIKQQQQRSYSSIKRMPQDKIGLRVYKDYPKAPATQISPKYTRNKDNYVIDVENEREMRRLTRTIEEQLRSCSSPNSKSEASPSMVKIAKQETKLEVRKFKKVGSKERVFLMAQHNELAASILNTLAEIK